MHSLKSPPFCSPSHSALRYSKWECWKLLLRASRFMQIQGSLLLFWPCLWGYIYGITRDIKIWELTYLLVGAIWMRSLGCIYNDWVDAPLDQFVPRTQNRPLIFRPYGWQKLMVLVCGAFGVVALYTLPLKVLCLGVTGWILSMTYPWLKRYIIPQGVLGVLFAWGVWIGAALSMNPYCFGCWGLYIIGILWTVEYDSIYSAPDRWADRELGLKSVAVCAGHRTRKILLGIFILRWVLMIILSTDSHKALVLAFISANITYYTLQRVYFSQARSCHTYFLLQAWIQGPLLTLWTYFVVPFG